MTKFFEETEIPKSVLPRFVRAVGRPSFGGIFAQTIHRGYDTIFESEEIPHFMWRRLYIDIPSGIPFFDEFVHNDDDQVTIRRYKGKTKHHLSALFYTLPSGILWLRTQIEELPDGSSVNFGRDSSLADFDTLLVDRRLIDMYRSHSGRDGLYEVLNETLSLMTGKEEDMLRVNSNERIAHMPHCKCLRKGYTKLDGVDHYMKTNKGYVTSYDVCRDLGYQPHECLGKLIVASNFDF